MKRVQAICQLWPRVREIIKQLFFNRSKREIIDDENRNCDFSWTRKVFSKKSRVGPRRALGVTRTNLSEFRECLSAFCVRDILVASFENAVARITHRCRVLDPNARAARAVCESLTLLISRQKVMKICKEIFRTNKTLSIRTEPKISIVLIESNKVNSTLSSERFLFPAAYRVNGTQ